MMKVIQILELDKKRIGFCSVKENDWSSMFVCLSGYSVASGLLTGDSTPGYYNII